MAVVGKDIGRIARAVTTQLNNLRGAYSTITALTDMATVLGLGPNAPRKEAAATKRELAEILGVSRRTVQRWFPARAAVKERHTPQSEMFERLRQVAEGRVRQAVRRDIMRHGLRAEVAGRMIDPSGNERDIDRDVTIPAETPELTALLDAWEANDRTAEADAFDEAFRAAWDEGSGALAGFELVDVYALRLSLA